MAAPLYHYVAPIVYRGKVAPNILARLQLPKEVINNRLLFHPYDIEDGDRPDTIAYHYYGSSYYDWIVLLSNQIINVREAWPLTTEQLMKAIISKYGSVVAATNLVDHYTINQNIDPINSVAFNALPEVSKKYFNRVATTSNNTTYGITLEDIRITPDSYSQLNPVEQVYWKAVNAYDTEYNLNETKRSIKLIDVQYVSQLEKSLRVLSKDVS